MPLNVGVNPGGAGTMKSGSALTPSVNTELTNLQGLCETGKRWALKTTQGGLNFQELVLEAEVHQPPRVKVL